MPILSSLRLAGRSAAAVSDVTPTVPGRRVGRINPRAPPAALLRLSFAAGSSKLVSMFRQHG
jgi:hypothetical protein